MIGTLIPQTTQGLAMASAAKSLVSNLVTPFIKQDIVSLLAKDIAGFRFDYIGEERLEAKSDITVHYTEDNNFFQDHIALNPIRITMKGFVSEVSLTQLEAVGLFGFISAALSPVTPYVSKYAPGASAAMEQAIIQANTVEQQIRRSLALARSVSKLFSSVGKNQCQQAYAYLSALRTDQWVFAVVTPFETFRYMALESLIMTSPDNSRTITDIEVHMVQIQFIQAISTPTNPNGRMNQTTRVIGQTGGGQTSFIGNGLRI